MNGAVSASARSGRLAQLVRAPALQAGGRRFEPCTAHQSSQAKQNEGLYHAKIVGYTFELHFSSREMLAVALRSLFRSCGLE